MYKKVLSVSSDRASVRPICSHKVLLRTDRLLSSATMRTLWILAVSIIIWSQNVQSVWGGRIKKKLYYRKKFEIKVFIIVDIFTALYGGRFSKKHFHKAGVALWGYVTI